MNDLVVMTQYLFLRSMLARYSPPVGEHSVAVCNRINGLLDRIEREFFNEALDF